jgi:hypothetical protein
MLFLNPDIDYRAMLHSACELFITVTQLQYYCLHTLRRTQQQNIRATAGKQTVGNNPRQFIQNGLQLNRIHNLQAMHIYYDVPVIRNKPFTQLGLPV